jgi:hypothetical protein
MADLSTVAAIMSVRAIWQAPVCQKERLRRNMQPDFAQSSISQTLPAKLSPILSRWSRTGGIAAS